MNYKWHSFFGFLVWICFVVITPTFETMFFGFFVALLSSIMPDVDTKKSLIGHTVRGMLVVCFFVISAFVYVQLGFELAAIFFLSTLILAIEFHPKHRGVTHSWAMPFVYSALIGIIFYRLDLALIAFFSYASHLALDKLRF